MNFRFYSKHGKPSFFRLTWLQQNEQIPLTLAETEAIVTSCFQECCFIYFQEIVLVSTQERLPYESRLCVYLGGIYMEASQPS